MLEEVVGLDGGRGLVAERQEGGAGAQIGQDAVIEAGATVAPGSIVLSGARVAAAMTSLPATIAVGGDCSSNEMARALARPMS